MSDASQLPLISHADAAFETGVRPQEITAFVSYSRPDRAVVTELAAALGEVGVVAKGDWGLTAGAPFRDVLGDWIISASTVVMMLTPEFLASDECAKEVEFAKRLGKRLAPIVLRRIPIERIPADLSAINWIVWPEDGNAHRVAALLREGIDKDFEWEREHSRLAGREEHWLRSGRKRSFTLRRDDLRQAESWIARAGADSHLTPRPTGAIIDFVTQSRHDEKIVLRTVFGAVIAVLLVLLGMGAYALQQVKARAASDHRSAEAEKYRLKADHDRLAETVKKLAAERRERTAKDLAATKEREAAVNAENALRERLRQTEDMGRQLLTEGKATNAAPYLSAVYSERLANPRLGDTDALRFMIARAVAPLRGRRALLAKDAIGVNFVAFSPDDSQIATVGDDGGMRIWDARTGRSRCSLRPDERSAMFGAAFTPDRNRVLAYESLYHKVEDKPWYSLRVLLLDCTNGQVIERYETDQVDGDSGWLWNGSYMPYFTEGGKAFYFDFGVQSRGAVFSLADGMALKKGGSAELARPQTVASSEKNPEPPCTDVTSGSVWASDDRSFVVDQDGMLYRTSDCAWLTYVEGPPPIRMAAFSHDNRLILAAYGDAAVLWEWQKSRPTLIAQWKTDGADAVFADSGGRKVVIALERKIEERDAPNGRVSSSITLPPDRTVTLIPLTERVLVRSKKKAELYDASTGKTLADLELDPSAVRNNSGGTAPERWQADPRTKLLMIKYPGQNDDGARTTFELRSLETGGQLSSMETVGDDFDALAMNWKAKVLFAASRNGSNASMWIDKVKDHWTPDYVRETETFGRARAAAFLPDGATILTADSDGMARFHDTKMLREPIRTRLSDVTEIAVSRDGSFALLGNTQSTEILDLEHYVSVGLCTGRISGDRWAMSADSRIAITSGPDTMVRVWDLRSGRLLSTMRVPGVPAPARFNEAGTEILVQAGKMTQLWSAGVERRSPTAVSREISRLLPLRLQGERLVPQK